MSEIIPRPPAIPDGAAARRPGSPCTGLCRLDPASGYCLGCARSAEEIALWGQAPDHVLKHIMAELPARRAELGIAFERLDWDAGDIAGFLQQTLRPGAGAWVFGIHGALGEFVIEEGEEVERRGDVCVATRRGAVRFDLPEKLRALAWGGGAATVLALPRARAALPAPARLTALGPDEAAIRAQDRAAILFDLGLGRSAARFCIRTEEPALRGRLEALAQRPWPEVMAAAGRAIQQSSPHRVILSPVGRMEVYSPIPAPDGRSPDGPHTHFLPDGIASGRETPPGMDVPDAYAPCATFYPAGRRTEPGRCHE